MDFEQFIKEAALLLDLQWRRFKRGGIKRKVERRITELGLSRFEEYLLKIRGNSEEKSRLSQILTVTISRFFRDKEVFDILESFAIPTVIKNKTEKGDVCIWSIGCASGEEPYSLLLLWKEKFEKVYPQIHLSIIATDINKQMLERAKEGRYRKSSLKEIPEKILQGFFKIDGCDYVLDRAIRDAVEFRRHDILRENPFHDMDLVCCRNLAFTYFSRASQSIILKKIAESIGGEGFLLIGKDESLPLFHPTLFVPTFSKEKIYRRFIQK
jgi:chemotaxis protein methyltransferase CheR